MPAVEKRISGEDNKAYDYESFCAYYKGIAKPKIIDKWWYECELAPAKGRGKGKGAGKEATPEPKAKVKAKAKAKVKAKAKKEKRAPPSIKLTYFAIEGVAEKIRLALTIGKIPFEDDRVTFEQWEAMKPTTKFGQLPMMKIGDGEPFAQSGAMLRYCGKLARMYPPYLTVSIEEAIGLEEDIGRSLMPSMILGRTPASLGHPSDMSADDKSKKQLEVRKALIEKPDGGLYKQLGMLEGLLKDNDYIAGKQPTIADCQVIQRIRHLKKGVIDGIPPSLLDDFPKLMEYFDRFHAIPEVKAYYEKLEAAK